MLGTKCTTKNKYEWINYRQVADMAEHLSYGLMALELVPEIEIDGKQMRFLGSLCKNRMERYVFHIAGMHQNITTLPLYQNFNDDQKRQMLFDTECTTIMISSNLLKKITQLKTDDTDGKLDKLTTLITICPDNGHADDDDGDHHHIDNVIDPGQQEEHEHANEAEDKEAAIAAGFTIYSWTEVIDRGRAAE